MANVVLLCFCTVCFEKLFFFHQNPAGMPSTKLNHTNLRWLSTVYGGHQMLSIYIITGAHCEGANNKCKDKTIIQDNKCYFTMLLLKVAQNKWTSVVQRAGL